MKNAEKHELINAQQRTILDRKAKLTATDYVASKIAEGAATVKDYAGVIADRQQWRQEINHAEAEIIRLSAIDEDDVIDFDLLV